MAFNKNYDTLGVGIVITYYERDRNSAFYVFIYCTLTHGCSDRNLY